MAVDFEDFEDFDRFLDEARRGLDALGKEPLPEKELAGGEGTAADGRVSARVSPECRLTSLKVDPRVVRMGSHELCDLIMVAVNAALDDLRANLEARREHVDVAGLAQALEGVQEESMRKMNALTQEIGDLARRIESRG
ncbi:YbaB/EbfC family nucleoid-associated protein [Nonomuraea basaltis]|uniref:YbaB/EbfC family nucleoid-associated protein n=1 Tax=Nonomuraea basaltis TaxID=2495887 RepID=UPI001486E23D|nr:YbaB/EbfC family nucleoid-associated protein [Nonomuraea basaltis]